MLKDYYQLTKPGIIRGNAITAAGGFFLASQGDINASLLAAMLIGLSLVIASACVFNNYIDRGIDKNMSRTSQRALAAGRISARSANAYGAVLGVLGGVILFLLTNAVAASIALLGFVMYVAAYGYSKRHSVHGTVVGSIPGAVPPVVGYSAVTGRLDMISLILFLILASWQMPHFYSISIFRLKDYKAASIPVLPAIKGVSATKVQIILYILIFMIFLSALPVFSSVGVVYLTIMLLLSSAWLILGIKGLGTSDNDAWARKMFIFSLVIILAFSILISIDTLLP